MNVFDWTSSCCFWKVPVVSPENMAEYSNFGFHNDGESFTPSKTGNFKTHLFLPGFLGRRVTIFELQICSQVTPATCLERASRWLEETRNRRVGRFGSVRSGSNSDFPAAIFLWLTKQNQMAARWFILCRIRWLSCFYAFGSGWVWLGLVESELITHLEFEILWRAEPSRVESNRSLLQDIRKRRHELGIHFDDLKHNWLIFTTIVL